MRSPLFKPGWSMWVLFILGWTLLSLLFAPEIYLFFLYRDEPISWNQTLALTLANSAIAFLFLPPIVWFTHRFPLEKRTWPKAFLAHLPACLLFSIGHASLYALWCYASPQLFHVLFARFQPNLLTYWAIVGFTQAMDYFQRYTQRERQLAQAELLLLKSQLHPHFLFNTLHTVSAMMQEDVKAADQTITRLSDLLRMTLDNIGLHEVSLRRELEFLCKYVEIEQTRFPGALQLDLDIQPEALDGLVPNMVLQPLVENSIRHGLALQAGHGVVRVSARVQEGRMRLQVADNGRGIVLGDRIREGTGLANTRQRLRQLYPDEHRFQIGAGPGSCGFQVSLEFPFRMITQVGEPTHQEFQAHDDSGLDRGRRALGAKTHSFPAQG